MSALQRFIRDSKTACDLVILPDTSDQSVTQGILSAISGNIGGTLMRVLVYTLRCVALQVVSDLVTVGVAVGLALFFWTWLLEQFNWLLAQVVTGPLQEVFAALQDVGRILHDGFGTLQGVGRTVEQAFNSLANDLANFQNIESFVQQLGQAVASSVEGAAQFGQTVAGSGQQALSFL